MVRGSRCLLPVVVGAVAFSPALTAQRQFKEIEGINSLPAITTYPYEVELGDVDGDGDLDMVWANSGLSIFATPNTVYINDGTGSFRDGLRVVAARSDHTAAVELGDVDGDGDLDIVYGNFRLQGSVKQNRLHLNDGEGFFTDVTSSHMPFDSRDTMDLALGDVDGDGDLDLFAANGFFGGDLNNLYLNDGTGRFTDATGQLPFALYDTAAVVLGDVDGDGDLDLVTGNGGSVVSRQNRLYLNNGSGTFVDATAGHMPVENDRAVAMALGDVDGDGDPDLVVGNWGQNRLYLNDGFGVFADATAGRLPFDADFTDTVALGDIDEDGDLDVAFGNGGPDVFLEQNRVLLNDGTGTFVDATGSRMPTRLDETAALALGDVDRDGDLDMVVGDFGIGPAWPDHLYLNLHRQLSRPALPALGQVYTLEFFAKAGYGNSPHTAAAVVAFELLPSPVPILNLGSLYLAPPFFSLPPVSIPQTTGMGVLPIEVPPIPELVGTVPYVQALIVNNTLLADAGFTGYLGDTIQP